MTNQNVGYVSPVTVDNVKCHWNIYHCCCVAGCWEDEWQVSAANGYARSAYWDDAVGRGEETKRCPSRHSIHHCCCSC